MKFVPLQQDLSFEPLLLFFSSSLIVKIFKDAYKDGKMFSVVVVDSRPRFEGIELKQFLFMCT